MNELQMESYMQGLQDRQAQALRASAEALAAGLGPDLEYLVFCLGDEEFAVPLLNVRAVLALPPTTPVPFMPEYHLGIANVRGQIISVMDLRKKLKLDVETTSETSVIILESGATCMGVVVNSINRVLSVRTEAEVRPVTLLDVAATLNCGNI